MHSSEKTHLQTVRGLLVLASLALACSAQERTTQLFDSGWLFRKGAPEGCEAPSYDDRSWRKVELPHDWGIEDLDALPADAQKAHLFVVDGSWRFRKGDNPSWKDETLDVDDWETVKLPADWASHSGYKEAKSYGWYRRKVFVPESLSGSDLYLELGWADDVDETYFNGRLVGHSGCFPPEFSSAQNERRVYRVPADVVMSGADNTVAVRIYNESGRGGLYGSSSARVVSGPFDSDTVGSFSTAYTVGGTACYRKRFTVPDNWRGRITRLRFDGVYMNAEVWLNGLKLASHPYGYTPLELDLTAQLDFGGKENVLCVVVRNEGQNSRWYAGSGIYRHVWLETLPQLHVQPCGVGIVTVAADAEKASLEIETSLRNRKLSSASVELVTTVVDGSGREVASRRSPLNLASQETGTVKQPFELATPSLWSPESPTLYKAVTRVLAGDEELDRLETAFGIRTLRFDPEKGFFLNGRSLKLKGGCAHADNGPLGAAAFDRAEERRVQLLRDAGFNTVRCAHNPPSPAFLDACDRLGLMVVDEAFDAWNAAHLGVARDDYHVHFQEWWERDLSAMLLRDRNHPSVILWSIGNQITDCTSERGARTARKLADFVHAFEPTRPVTSNVFTSKKDWRQADDFFAALDVGGYSYAGDRFDEDHRRLPGRVILASEVASKELFLNWTRVLDRDYVCGNFEWTAFDYLGEVGLGWVAAFGHETELVPWISSYSGDFDLCGFRKPRSHYRDALWSDKPVTSLVVHTPLPSFPGQNKSKWGWDDVKRSWTWNGYEGRPLEVEVYSNCDTVRLLLDGRDLGERSVSRDTEYKASWQVPYAPGKLVAVGFRKGEESSRDELETAGAPRFLRLSADRSSLSADGQDLAYVTVELVDEQGRVCPAGDLEVRFELEGPGTLAAVGSSNPRSFESFRQPRRKLYEGRCLAIVRTGRDQGTVILKASADGLPTASAQLSTTAPANGVALLEK